MKRAVVFVLAVSMIFFSVGSVMAGDGPKAAGIAAKIGLVSAEAKGPFQRGRPFVVVIKCDSPADQQVKAVHLECSRWTNSRKIEQVKVSATQIEATLSIGSDRGGKVTSVGGNTTTGVYEIDAVVEWVDGSLSASQRFAVNIF